MGNRVRDCNFEEEVSGLSDAVFLKRASMLCAERVYVEGNNLQAHFVRSVKLKARPA